MATPAEIIDIAASALNDTPQYTYTDVVSLPYLNMALRELQEIFQLNNVPVTNETSALIEVPAGIDKLGFNTLPGLPRNLIEIRNLWESQAGLNQWTPMGKRDFIPHSLEDNTQISQFLIWAWLNQEIRLIAANADNDLKLDYIQNLFALPILIGAIDVDLQIINTESYLGFKTAAFMSWMIEEDEFKSVRLEGEANDALYRSLGISTKGRQSIVTRRRPFRSSFKRRRSIG